MTKRTPVNNLKQIENITSLITPEHQGDFLWEQEGVDILQSFPHHLSPAIAIAWMKVRTKNALSKRSSLHWICHLKCNQQSANFGICVLLCALSWPCWPESVGPAKCNFRLENLKISVLHSASFVWEMRPPGFYITSWEMWKSGWRIQLLCSPFPKF